MKSYLIALFILLTSLNANSYVPLFLVQERLNGYPEQLIVQIKSIAIKVIPGHDDKTFNYYQIKLSVDVKFIGKTDSELKEGDVIQINYKTSEIINPNTDEELCGYMPIETPHEQDLVVVYLNKKGGSYIVDKYWALQIATPEYQVEVLSNLENYKTKTPDWIKAGLCKLQEQIIQHQL